MTNSRNKRKNQIKVTFTLEERELTSTQKEAGKRLFSRLIERAQAQIDRETANKEQERNPEHQ
jgi:translation initiation factor IF-3